MPRQLWIDDHIEMRGDALHRSNMDGPWNESMVHFHDHFLADTLDTNLYVATENDAGTAVAIAVAIGGQCRFTTSSTASGQCSLATALNWEDDMYARAEAYFKIADVDKTAVFFGFNEVDNESATVLPIDYDGGSITVASGRDAVGFIIDADHQTSSIMCVSAAAGTPTTAVDSLSDWEDNAWHTLRVELTPDAKADFYLDGVSVGHINDALTSGTALCMFMGVGRRGATGKYVYLDRWDAWQKPGE